MEVLGPFWPSLEDQAVMQHFFERYPTLAPGMCYLFGAQRQGGLTCQQATMEVYRIVEIELQVHGAGGPL